MNPRVGLSGRSAFLSLVLLSTFAFLLSSKLRDLADRVWQTNPFSWQHQINQPFVPTPSELACLHGQDPSTFSPVPDIEPIPNIVHFIFGLRNPLTHPHAGHFDFLCYLALRSAIVSLSPSAVHLHYTYLSSPPSADYRADPKSNPWIKRLAKDITLVNHPPEEFTKAPYDASAGGWQAAHVSDILRLQLLKEHGGIYLDIDAFALKSFEPVLKSPRDIVLGHEGGNRWGLCNAIMAARQNSTFVDMWLESYVNADLSKEWNYHSVLLPKKMEQKHPQDVCALPPTSFFWPTWTWKHVEWMHERLTVTETAHWADEIQKHGGALFEDQLAYHAWNQMAYERYLKHLTPDIVRTHNTRFNLLMRRFVEADVR